MSAVVAITASSLMNILRLIPGAARIALACALTLPSITNAARQPSNNSISYDGDSFFVHGERIMLYSGEFHPFRQPVPGLWLDSLQKLKGAGFNCVSIYTHWGLLEAEKGQIATDGIWDLEAFFNAASEAGIYVVARPGPYINAESTVGGLPGWVLRLPCTLRTDCPEYLEAVTPYLITYGEIIARAEISNGGPVILIQPENEYSWTPGTNETTFPTESNRVYQQYVQDVLRKAGVTVPFINNDNTDLGLWAPGTGLGEVDVYSFDDYPMGFFCEQPWGQPPTDYLERRKASPNTPFAISEFQGGSIGLWGISGNSPANCAAHVDDAAIRVYYKNNYAAGVKFMNIYMAVGSTNWGNIGSSFSPTTYDYAAAIPETRLLTRDKYYELKLQATFLKTSPSYLVSKPANSTASTYSSSRDITISPLFGEGNDPCNIYVARNTNASTEEGTKYSLTLPFGSGEITLPQLGGELTMPGKDSKVHVTQYPLGDLPAKLAYSTAEIFTWGSTSRRGLIILYAEVGETHEYALPKHLGRPEQIEGPNKSTKIKQVNGLWVVQWKVTSARQVVSFPNIKLKLHMLSREDAYHHWRLELPSEKFGNYTSETKQSVIVKGGYLLRAAEISGHELKLTGDINATTDFELLFDPTEKVKTISFNGESAKSNRGEKSGCPSLHVPFAAPNISLPDLTAAKWSYLDTLPELVAEHDDSAWTNCNLSKPSNTSLPKSLLAGDYGYFAGHLLYRSHFTATGEEDVLHMNATGGGPSIWSVWLNSTFLGSASAVANLSINSSLISGEPYVLTVLIDHAGQDQITQEGLTYPTNPRGILDVSLTGHNELVWKMTGNLGGEQYRDRVRGPLNEGGLFAERQAYHMPGAPTQSWNTSSPFETGLRSAGVGFYATSFQLNLPAEYDIPIEFVFGNTTAPDYRVQLFVNGYQFGRFLPSVGPQLRFPVPEGILNYRGLNYVALTLRAEQSAGAVLSPLTMEAPMPILSGYKRPASAPQPQWEERVGSY